MPSLPVSSVKALAPRRDTKNLATLAGSSPVCSREDKGTRRFGLKGFLFRLRENRQGREGQDKTRLNDTG